MAATNAKVTPQFNVCHELFIEDFVSQIERKLFHKWRGNQMISSKKEE